VLFQTLVVEWIPRENGGGIAGRHEMTDPAIRKARKENGNSMVGLKNGDNDLIETVYLYCNLLSDDGKEVIGFGVFPVKSTSLQPVKGFRTAMQMVKGKPPYFAFRAKLSSEKKSNDQGTWYRLKVSPLTGSNWMETMMQDTQFHDQAMDYMAKNPEQMNQWMIHDPKHVEEMSTAMRENHDFMMEMMSVMMNDPDLRLQMLGHMTENPESMEQMKKMMGSGMMNP